MYNYTYIKQIQNIINKLNRQSNSCNNKIMIDKVAKNQKQKNYKTQMQQQLQGLPFQFGKPIRLPKIRKKKSGKLSRYDNTIDRFLQSKDKNNQSKITIQKQDMSLNAEEIKARKFSNNSQHHLNSQQRQLCADRSKKLLPKISVMGSISKQNTDRSVNEEFHRRLNRIKSQKKIDSNTSQLSCYKLGAIIGRGNYSIVKLCETTGGKKYAAKVYAKHKINTSQRQINLKQQISILKSLNHPSIISFKQYIETQQNHYIIMQVFDNISLLQFIKRQSIIQSRQQNHTNLSSEPCTSRFRQRVRLNQPTARIIMKKVIQAFAYLHENGIAHRDIKLENILVAYQGKQDIIVKVIDFGFSRRCTLEKQSQIFLAEMKENKREYSKKKSKIQQQQDVFYDYCGTPPYISPEITQKKGYLARPSDVWALGVLLFYLITGNFPFKITTQKSDFSNSIYQQISLNLQMSPSLVSMLKKMLRNDPGSRPTLKQLLSKEQWLHSQI